MADNAVPSLHIDCKQLTDLCVRWDIHFAELGFARDLGGLRNSNTHPPILQLPTPDSRHHESPPPPTHPHPVSFLLHNHHFKTPLNHALHSFRLPCLSTLSSTSTSLPTLIFRFCGHHAGGEQRVTRAANRFTRRLVAEHAAAALSPRDREACENIW